MNAVRTLPARVEPASGLLAKGKAFVHLYKTGVKNLWGNRKEATQIRAKYGASSGLELARSIVENTHLAHIKSTVAKTPFSAPAAVSRSELLTVLRTERDFYKLPLFCVVFAVFFEMTPILLWACPRLAPSICYSVAYRHKREAEHSRVQETLRRDGQDLDGSESVYRLQPRTLRQLAVVLDFGLPFRYAPISLLRRRMMKHLTEVRADDIILRQQRDHINELLEEELTRALMARNLPLGGGVASLERWIDGFQEPLDTGLFVNPTALLAEEKISQRSDDTSNQ